MGVPPLGYLFEPRPGLVNSGVELSGDLGEQVLPACRGLLDLLHQAVEFTLRKLFDLGLDCLKAFVDLAISRIARTNWAAVSSPRTCSGDYRHSRGSA